MKAAETRTAADWKAALLTLPDGPFFDLMRGYLGDIKTPFNKQRLVDDLSGFLGRREIQETVVAYLDETDRKLIAAVWRLGEPTATELTSFFDGELSFAELHSILLNLEERLIVYRFDDGGVRKLSLNPILFPAIAPIAQDTSILFPSMQVDAMEHTAPIDAVGDEKKGPEESIDCTFLAAVVSFLYRRGDLFRADGAIRKKIAEEAALIFPYARFEWALAALRSLGCLRGGDGTARCDEDRLVSLAELPFDDRALYLAAALCSAELGMESSGIDAESGLDDDSFGIGIGIGIGASPALRGGRASRERLSSWARLFRDFLASLEEDKVYPRTTLIRLLDVQERHHAAPRRKRWEERLADPAASFRAGFDPSSFRNAALRALEHAGLLELKDDGTRRLVVHHATSSGPSVVLDSSFSVLMYPEIEFRDALTLSTFLDVREVGRVIRFELGRESAVRGFDRGMSVEDMLGLLERLSGGTAAQNIRWSLKDWRDRYASVSLHRGIVLVVAEDRRYIVETGAISSLISRELAPGVYLLSVVDEGEAARALEKAGVDIVAMPPGLVSPRHGPTESHISPFPALDRGHRAGTTRSNDSSHPFTASENLVGADVAPVTDRLRVLHSALAKKNLPKDQRDELAARVDRRVILSESQLVGAAVRYEKLEAKGLDYVGKVRVAEQALATGSLVEIFWRGSKGEPERVIGSPVSLEKSAGEIDLILNPAPRGDRVKVPIGKISLLRRIKRSMFGE